MSEYRADEYWINEDGEMKSIPASEGIYYNSKDLFVRVHGIVDNPPPAGAESVVTFTVDEVHALMDEEADVKAYQAAVRKLNDATDPAPPEVAS